MIDRVLINLASILISGTGVFVVLTKFNVPELRSSFYGQNPFMIKAGPIDNVTTWVFTSLALIGLLLQAAKEVFGDSIPDSLHSARYYLCFFVIGVFAMVWLVWGLSAISRLIARPFWLPKVLKSQREVFSKAVFITEHNGWREDQLDKKDSLQDPERFRTANYESVETSLRQIEKLLDLPQRTEDFSERINQLKPYFSKDE